MEEKDKITVKWAQEDVETSNNLLNNNIEKHEITSQSTDNSSPHQFNVMLGLNSLRN